MLCKQRCYQDQGVRDQDQTKTRQAETKTETKTREAETKTKTKTSKSGLDRSRDQDQVSRPTSLFVSDVSDCTIPEVLSTLFDDVDGKWFE